MLTVKGSVLMDNSAAEAGGAVANGPKPTATIKGTTISHNSTAAGGGLASQGDLTLHGSLVTANTASAGGGVFELGGKVTLQTTVVTRNVPDNCEPLSTIPGTVISTV